VGEKKWYIVQTYSGYEKKAKLVLEERIRSTGSDAWFEEIYIPMETTTQIRNGKRIEVQKKVYTGYIFVKMELNDQSWHIIKNTPKIVGFIGGTQRAPAPVPESEVKQIEQRIEEGSISTGPTFAFAQGDKVRIIEGNFKDFTGTVEEVDEEKERLKVYVEIFGRPTSVEFDFDQVAEADE